MNARMQPSDTDLTQIHADSHAVLSQHGRSFALAGLFLPHDQANDAAVAYAFCRLADDLADEAPDLDTARRDLATLSAELEGHRPPRPVVYAYMELAARRGFPLSVARDLIDGVLSDLHAVRVQTDEELSLYCYRVAGTVGLMMAAIMGVSSPDAAAPAKALGEAMQLTNICRDVLEDAGRDRCYLPATRLHKAGTDAAAIVAGDAPDSAVQHVVRDLLAMAEARYHEAWRGMHYIPWRPRVAIYIAARLYRQIGVRLLTQHDANPMWGRTVVPKWARLLLVGRGLLDAVFGVKSPYPTVVRATKLKYTASTTINTCITKIRMHISERDRKKENYQILWTIEERRATRREERREETSRAELNREDRR